MPSHARSALALLAAAVVMACARRDDAAVRGAFAPAPRAIAAATALPTIGGRAESCVVCHAGIEGLDASHRPEQIGCSACHGGVPIAREANTAHAGMRLVPGNLADAAVSCGAAACHAGIVPRVERSIMTTMAGIIAVDREVFGDRTAGNRTAGNRTAGDRTAGDSTAGGAPPHVRELGHSKADTHLRQLCASCHIGQQKVAWSPVTESARGGGCLACHLVYDSTAARQLAAYTARTPSARAGIPRRHPALRAAVRDEHCFGCHSRSSRIAANYAG